MLETLLFLMPLFYYAPNLILAAIIITAVIGLIGYEAALKLWKLDKLHFVACLCSFFGVLFISVPLGLAVAVGVSVFKIMLHVTRPNTVVMGNILGTSIYRNIARYNEAVRIPSFLIIAVEAPIYFANSTYLQESMIPHKTRRGAAALARLKVFEGVPPPYDKTKKMVIPDALKVLRLQAGHKYCLLGRLSAEVGWNHYDIIRDLEKKRKERSQIAYEKKKQLNKLRIQAGKIADEKLGAQLEVITPIKY